MRRLDVVTGHEFSALFILFPVARPLFSAEFLEPEESDGGPTDKQGMSAAACELAGRTQSNIWSPVFEASSDPILMKEYFMNMIRCALWLLSISYLSSQAIVIQDATVIDVISGLARPGQTVVIFKPRLPPKRM